MNVKYFVSWLGKVAIVALFLLNTSGCVTQTDMTNSTILTITPSLPASTRKPVPTVSVTPIPTLSITESENLVNQLLTKDYDCKLPCWGGIEPGVTTWPETRIFLEQFSEIHSNQSAKILYKGESVYTFYYVNNNIVEFMGMPRFEYPTYRLLQDYGKPDEIYIYILDVLPVDTINPYTVYLFYKEKGIVAEYSGVSDKGEILSVCFRDAQEGKIRNSFLWLWSKGSDKAFDNITAEYMNRFSEYSSLDYYKIEEKSTYTPQDFYEIYELEANENYCLKINNPNPKPS